MRLPACPQAGVVKKSSDCLYNFEVIDSTLVEMRAIMKLCLLSLVFLFCLQDAFAKIVRIEITGTEVYDGARKFGDAGEYIRISGWAYGEVDPNNSLNSIIQDIQLAPRNAGGMVEYTTQFVLLRPVNMSKCNGILFLSLPNRGNVFPPDTALLKRGYIYLWSAWQGDVLPGNNRVLMEVPVAKDSTKEITGRIRTEFEVTDITKTLNLSSGYFSGMTHHSYETVSLDNSTATLTKRVHEEDQRQPVPNSDWAFADCSLKEFPGFADREKISLKGGFDPNYIYELIYTGKNPLVMGLGFAAIRDVASFFKYQLGDERGHQNPLVVHGNTTTPVKAAIVQGVSQCGNFTRIFLQLGFNEDENKKIVFEGVNDHIGTRRVSLNIRFGRPGGGGMQREDHLFPSNEPPFTWDVTLDPISGVKGGILEKCLETNTCPKIIQTLSSSEYWQLRASLRTTDTYSKKDIPISSNVRIYLFNSTQHGPFKTNDKVSGFTTNDNNYLPNLRALLIALENWVLNDKQPPASDYPRIDNNTLVRPDKKSVGWTDIPGVPYSGEVNDGALLDYGPDFNYKYISGVLREPPAEIKDKFYHVLVPKVDKDDNELGGIRNTTVMAPLGTYTGWSLRKKGYGEGDLNGLNGMFIPFKKTKAERTAANDPRLSLEERYQTHEGYVNAVKKAADELVRKGFLLAEDAANIVGAAEASDVLK